MEDLALLVSVAGHEVRRAIIKELNPHSKHYMEIKIGVSKTLGREVSDGSLTWHLQGMRASGTAQKNEDDLWSLTSLGLRLSMLLEKLGV
jgi:hypothetical protein